MKPNQLLRLNRIYRRRIPPDQVLTNEVATYLSQLSFEVKRQIGVIISRRGIIEDVFVGDEHGVVIPDLSRYRLGRKSLRGVRLIHTHLRNETLTQDDLTDLALLRLDLIAALGVQDDGRPGMIYLAHILPPNPRHAIYDVWAPIPCHALSLHLSLFLNALDEELARAKPVGHMNPDVETALLVSVSQQSRMLQEQSMDELRELAVSAGIVVLDTLIQTTQTLHPKYLLGKGKLKEVVIRALHHGADFLVFDQNLTPAQSKAISEVTEMKVIDRTQLILDIFSRRAHSRQSTIQVELAQLRYLLPRLSDRSTALSRLTGGIGGRGPGETKLELDRRRIRDRIAHLEREQTSLATHRCQQRSLRTRRRMPVVSLIGYTNAGKSTLLNALTQSHVEASARLFTSLDTTSRRLRLDGGREVILTDTVGFMKNLPRDLLGAFKTTLEELRDADLLLHVCDMSSPFLDERIQVVSRMLEDLNLQDIPSVRVLNKADLVPPPQAEALCRRMDGVAISALRPGTLPPLLAAIEQRILNTEPAAQILTSA